MLNITFVRSALALANTRFVTVTFMKKDGTIRTINGLLHPKSKMANSPKSVRVRETLAKAGLVPIWSPNEGWKSFRPQSVLSINAENMKLNAKGV